MRIDSQVFDEKNRASSKHPRVVVELNFDNDNTDKLYLTTYLDDEAPPASIAAGEVIYGVVKGISGQSQSIDPIRAVSTIGGFSFSAVDVDEAVTVYLRDKLDAGDGLRHKQIVVYVGDDGLLWDDYQAVLTYIIDGVDFVRGEYKFTCSDIQRQERRQIFEPQVRNLSKSITATQTHIPVLTADLSEFPVVKHDASYTDQPSKSVGYALIEDEIFSHTGLFTHTTDGVSFQVLERGALNTRSTEHVFDEAAASDRTLKITEHVYLEGPAPKIIYALLTGVLHADSASLPDHWNLGISTTYVKLSDFTGIGPDLWDTTAITGRVVRLNGPDASDGKRFIERELLLWLGCFMPVYSTGELGLRRLSPVLTGSSYLQHLTTENVVSFSTLKHDYSEVINKIEIKWNHVFIKDEFTKTNVLIDADSIAKHNQGKTKVIKLFAVHTGAHTDKDLDSYFDSLRDRYSGPPLRMSMVVMPSLNRLEVGDTVRVELEQARDFNEPTATTLDRVFEVQRVQNNWLTGHVSLDLFGSSQPAGVLTKTAESSVLDDSFYTSEGTELSTVLTISGGAVTASGSLAGATTLSSGIYYYDGDLTINAGVVVTINKNVQLRIKGSLTINGDIDGAGNGLAGGVGATAWVGSGTDTISYPAGDPLPVHNAGLGLAGYLGITTPCGDNAGVATFFSSYPVIEGAPTVPSLNVVNNSTSIVGLPTDLRGVSGSGGGVVHSGTTSGGTTTRVIEVDGTDGGDSGAGLLVISRGMSFGAAGSIDLSGDDAVLNSGTFVAGNFTNHGSPGAGGAPGGFVLLLDGNHTPPELADNLISLHGNSPFGGDRRTPFTDFLDKRLYSSLIGTAGFDMGASAYKIQFIPESGVISEELDPPPPDVTNFTVGSSGSTVVFRWNEVVDNNLDGYEIRYTKDTINDWDAATVLTRAAKGTRITDTDINSGDWRFYIKAIDLAKQYSQAATTYDATVISDFDIIDSNEEHPEWARQNWLTQSNNLSHTDWPTVGITPVDNSDGTWTLTDNSAVLFEFISQSPTAWSNNETYCVALKVKKDSDTTRFPMLRVSFSGSTLNRFDVMINTSTGATIAVNDAVAADVESLDLGSFWLISVKGKTIDAANTVMTAAFYPAVGTVWGVYNASAQGSAIVKEFSLIESSLLGHDYIETAAVAIKAGGNSANFVRHYTGKLVPKSQNLASADGYDTFDIAVINPFETCTYESSELDTDFDDTVRAWSETSGALMPGVVGDTAITDFIDYRLAAGVYDGFEVWGVGEIEARYVKFKLELDTTKGVSYIDEQTITADTIERIEEGLNVSVGAGGLAVVFSQAYHNVPAVTVEMVGGGAVFATASAITTTGFTINVYNTSGVGVAGTVNHKATGV